MTLFLGNILVGVKVVFLLDCPLVLSLLRHRGVGAFLNQKNEESKQEKYRWNSTVRFLKFTPKKDNYKKFEKFISKLI